MFKFYLFVWLALPFVAPPPNSASAAEKRLSDDEIHDAVRRRLANDYEIKGALLEVEVAEGVVTLSGTVELEKHKAKAERLTKKVSGVRSVVNELRAARK